MHVRLRIELVHRKPEVALLQLRILPGVENDGQHDEEDRILGSQEEVEKSGKLAKDLVALKVSDVDDEPVDADGDEDDGDQQVSDGQQQEEDVRHHLLLGEVDDEGSDEDDVQDEAGHEGQDEEGGVAPPVVGELRREEVRTGEGGLRVAALVAGPGSVEKHCPCLSTTCSSSIFQQPPSQHLVVAEMWLFLNGK